MTVRQKGEKILNKHDRFVPADCNTTHNGLKWMNPATWHYWWKHNPNITGLSKRVWVFRLKTSRPLFMLVPFHHFCSSQGNLEKSNISSFVLLSTHQSGACISWGNDACNFSVLTNYTYCIMKGRVEWSIKVCVTGLLQLCKKYLHHHSWKIIHYTQWSQNIVLNVQLLQNT